MLHKSTNVNDVNESIKIERLKQITLARGEKEDIARERGVINKTACDAYRSVNQ